MYKSWSIVFCKEESPNEYLSLVLSSESKYDHPLEWETRWNALYTYRVKLIDYREITEEEWSLYKDLIFQAATDRAAKRKESK